MARKVKAYLVIAVDGSVRAGLRPRVQLGEVMYQLNITIPDGWGRLAGSIDITLPDPPGVVVAAEGSLG